MKSKKEILMAKTAKEVLDWIKAAPEQFDAEVGEYFNRLVQKEFEARIPNYNPDIHYDFLQDAIKNVCGADAFMKTTRRVT